MKKREKFHIIRKKLKLLSLEKGDLIMDMPKRRIASKKEMQGIEIKISLTIIIAVVLSVCIVGVVCIGLSYSSSMNILSATMNETSRLAADRVLAEINTYLKVASESGKVARLANDALSVEEKKEIIQQRITESNFLMGDIIGADGKSIFDGSDYSQQSYFSVCMNGKESISDPYPAPDGEGLLFIVAAPLWKGGIPNTEVIGVIAMVPPKDFINEMLDEIDIGQGGAAFIVDSKGNSIADTDRTVVGKENLIEEARTDKSKEKIAEIIQQMIQGKDSFGEYRYNGDTEIISYSPIPHTNGWSIGVVAMKGEFFQRFYISVGITIIVMITFILISIYFGKSLGKEIANPINQCVERLKLLAQGDLDSPVPVLHNKDETDLLLSCLKVSVEKLKEIVSDINEQLGEMAQGNLCIIVEKDYDGNFRKVSEAVRVIVKSLKEAMKNIDMNSEQVKRGSLDLAKASQDLAEGATNQASAIEELTATINEIAEQVQENAQGSQDAKEKIAMVSEKMRESDKQMKQMAGAMEEIKMKSNDISAIIQTIESIASQTNLLSLNAAIEAARAGEAGRSFAVVAEEVRQLAEQSAEAAKNTTNLIKDSIYAVDRGMVIAEETAQIMNETAVQAETTVDVIYSIARASHEQAEAIEQISQGIDQIAAVVETNSATAQESAASSEELSSEAIQLKEMVGKFHY